MYGIHNQMEDMETACVNLDRQELSRLVTAFYISKGLIYQKCLLYAFFNKGIFQLLYIICCITGTVFTWLIVTLHEEFSWSRSLILVFLSSIVISFEGSLIYYFFFSEAQTNSENYTVLFLTYNLVMQDLGVQISAFLARLPVNLIDKAIAVFGGLGISALVKKIVEV